jgi:RimJ/RimL family protein N-acetyltransferase
VLGNIEREMDIQIRPMIESDLPVVNHIRNQSRSFLHNESEYTLDQTISWFFDTNPEWYIIEANERVVGYFRTSEHSHENRSMCIGADIEEESRGKGIAKQAYRKMMRFLFEKHKLQVIRLEVLETNTRAISLYKKLGFTENCTTKVWRKSEKRWIDSIHMSMHRVDFISYQLNGRDGIPLSPCNGICSKGESMCLSCGRTLEEISQWKNMEIGSKIACIDRISKNKGIW